MSDSFTLFTSIYIYVKMATTVEGDPKGPFSIATTPFYGLLHFTLSMDYFTLPLVASLYPYNAQC